MYTELIEKNWSDSQFQLQKINSKSSMVRLLPNFI